MIDFAIDPQGDLILEEFQEPKGMNLSFRLVQQNKGIKVKFHSIDPHPNSASGQFQLSFYTKRRTGPTFKTKLVKDIEQKIQQIRILLTTERGELPYRNEIGSRLTLARHENIHDIQNLQNIEEFVLEAISGILDSPEVKAIPEKGVGNFYCQNVNIYIYDNDMLIFKFQI